MFEDRYSRNGLLWQLNHMMDVIETDREHCDTAFENGKSSDQDNFVWQQQLSKVSKVIRELKKEVMADEG